MFLAGINIEIGDSPKFPLTSSYSLNLNNHSNNIDNHDKKNIDNTQINLLPDASDENADGVVGVAYYLRTRPAMQIVVVVVVVDVVFVVFSLFFLFYCYCYCGC